MKILRIFIVGSVLTALAFCLISAISKPWGFWAHKRINRLATFTLPPNMIVFYKKNLEYITEHAVDPDKRRYALEEEAARHYIDIDHYGEYPWDMVPHRWEDAVNRFTEDTLKAYGIVPWHTEKMFYSLTNAFKDKNIPLILKYSADIGHYIADGHVPLHTSENYNGQKTGQEGIHGFWESRVPELMGESYDYFVGKANYIENPNAFIWEYILESAVEADSVLHFEKLLNDRFPSDQKYTFEDRGAVLTKVYSQEYTKAYSEMLDNMVERRIRKTIIDVGSLWFTAWVNAGQPDLGDLPEYKLSKEDEEDLKKLDEALKGGVIKGRSCQ